MKRLVRKLLMGDTTFCQYAKIAVPAGVREKVYLKIKDRIFDISENQWVLCMEPFVFGVWIEQNEADTGICNRAAYHIYIDDIDGGDQRRMASQAEAFLTLDFVDAIREKEGTLLLLKLKRSCIYQLNFAKRYLIYFRYYKKPGLSFSRFKSFAACYSYPRQVRLISFRQGEYYNIFPMDLLGEVIGHNRFVFGLQCKNVTLPKILETRKLVVSTVSYQYKDIIYQLGKHHSGHPPARASLPFEVITSDNFNFFVPVWTESYQEVRILQTRKMGSHMLLWAEIIATRRLSPPVVQLSTVHFLHFLHRKNQGRPYIQA